MECLKSPELSFGISEQISICITIVLSRLAFTTASEIITRSPARHGRGQLHGVLVQLEQIWFVRSTWSLPNEAVSAQLAFRRRLRPSDSAFVREGAHGRHQECTAENFPQYPAPGLLVGPDGNEIR